MSSSTLAPIPNKPAPVPPDPRSRLPNSISRFLGYRPHPPPYAPLPFPPFTYLHHIPLAVEVWIFATIGAFVSMLLIQAVMVTSPTFSAWNSPIIITSFGASAVLVFGVIESPLAQPQNLVVGQMLSAFIGVALTKLFMDGNAGYVGELEEKGVQGGPFVNGALSMALSLLGMQMFGVTHPPGGPTALSAGLEPQVLQLGWRYLLVILASSLIMLGWALIINNLGRRRYPVYWIKADGIFPLLSAHTRKRQERRLEVRRRTREEGGKEAEEGGTQVPAGTGAARVTG